MFQDKKVLIVDDSATERFMLSQILTKMGFKVFEATNGEEGVKKSKEIEPDLIMMDVLMEGLNGFQATREIKKNEFLKNIPVIMCTSKNGDVDKLWGQKQGAAAYVVKPVKEEEITKAVNEVLLGQ